MENKKIIFHNVVLIQNRFNGLVHIDYIQKLEVINLDLFNNNVKKIIERKRCYIILKTFAVAREKEFKNNLFGPVYLFKSFLSQPFAKGIYNRINGPSCILFDKSHITLWYEVNGLLLYWIHFKFNYTDITHNASKRNRFKAKMILKYGNL